MVHVIQTLGQFMKDEEKGEKEKKNLNGVCVKVLTCKCTQQVI